MARPKKYFGNNEEIMLYCGRSTYCRGLAKMIIILSTDISVKKGKERLLWSIDLCGK
jgi:hypothetical protein